MSVHREKVRMLFLLAKNDIHAKYSGSVFGIVWAFALPLVTILVFWVVFQAGFRNRRTGQPGLSGGDDLPLRDSEGEKARSLCH